MKYSRRRIASSATAPQPSYIYLLYIFKVLTLQSSNNVHSFTLCNVGRNYKNRIMHNNNLIHSQPQLNPHPQQVLDHFSFDCGLRSTSVDQMQVGLKEEKKTRRRRTSTAKGSKKKRVDLPIQIQPLSIATSVSTPREAASVQSYRTTTTAMSQSEKISKNPSTTIISPTRTVKMKKRKSSPRPSSIRVSNLLTKEEEVTLTSAIRELKSIIRIRDELSISKTMNNPGSTPSSYLPNPMYKHQYNTSLSSPYKIQPTESEWAQACNNISIVRLRRILVKGRESRKRLVDGNVGLVTQIAKRYSEALEKSAKNSGLMNIGCILTLGDLIQEGNLGLMEAAERFDSSKGFRFATYAVYWVRSRILRCIADNSRVIRLPQHGMFYIN